MSRSYFGRLGWLLLLSPLRLQWRRRMRSWLWRQGARGSPSLCTGEWRENTLHAADTGNGQGVCAYVHLQGLWQGATNS
jgi:hypothetical protein